MACKVEIYVCSEIPTVHLSQCKHHVEFLNVKSGGT
jgi:hypothetical protein